MRMKFCFSFLVLGVVALCVSVAAAEILPTPVVHLKLDGDLTNSGSGGSAYDGVLETAAPNGGTPVYVSAMEGQGLQINPSLPYPGGTTDTVPADNGNNVAVSYTLPDSGTIALWYDFTSPHYNYQGIFNNSAHRDKWECWADAWDHDGGRGNCFGARAGGYYADAMIIPFTDGWHHVALTWTRHTDDPTKVDFTTYYDGATNPGATITNVSWSDPGDKFLLGGNYGNGNGNGTWDDVRIYDECLTGDQVAAVMTSVPEPSTLALLLTAMVSFYALRRR